MFPFPGKSLHLYLIVLVDYKGAVNINREFGKYCSSLLEELGNCECGKGDVVLRIAKFQYNELKANMYLLSSVSSSSNIPFLNGKPDMSGIFCNFGGTGNFFQ